MAPRSLIVLAVVLSLLCHHVHSSAALSFGGTMEPLPSDSVSADQGAGNEGRRLIQFTPAPQYVSDAVLAAFLNLLEINYAETNPLDTYEVNCEVWQRVGGPYLLNTIFAAKLPPTFALRSCTFLNDAPIVIAFQYAVCQAGCSPKGCSCCDGTLNLRKPGTADPNPNATCPLYTGTTCSVCSDYFASGGADSSLNTANTPERFLYDLDLNTTTPIENFVVPPTIGTLPTYPPNSVVSLPPYDFGPDVRAVGPFGVAGIYGYIPAGQLRPGGRYRIGRPNSNYYYEFTIADNSPCNPYIGTPNQCFNAPGSGSTCCAGECPNTPIALPSCGTYPTAAATVAPPPSNPAPTPGPSSPTPGPSSPTPGPSAPTPSAAAAPTCDPTGPLPNQCFNAAGTKSVCCGPRSCPDEPGPEPFCKT